MVTGSAMNYGVAQKSGARHRESTPDACSDAEATGRLAVQKLVASPHLSHVTMASELRDAGDIGYFKHESIYQRLASEAGFELAVNVIPDRRGYLHCLQICRKSNESRRFTG